MAKSLRSKWKRKCRAVKRERYGKKELERLKKTLGVKDERTVRTDINTQTQDISDIVTVTTVEEIKSRRNELKNNVVGDMEVEQIKSNFNTRTLRNKHGAYPVWLHPRKIKKTSKKVKKEKAKGKIKKKNK